MKKQIKNKKFKQWIVVKNKIDVGYIRILDGDVSILLREEYQGKGFGTQILKLLEKQLSIPRKLIAIINSDNISSIKAFENAGYKLKTMTYEKNI